MLLTNSDPHVKLTLFIFIVFPYVNPRGSLYWGICSCSRSATAREMVMVKEYGKIQVKFWAGKVEDRTKQNRTN